MAGWMTLGQADRPELKLLAALSDYGWKLPLSVLNGKYERPSPIEKGETEEAVGHQCDLATL